MASPLGATTHPMTQPPECSFSDDSGGATNSWSADRSYRLQGSFRLTAIRESFDGGYVLGHGFWAYFQSCCIGIGGNVDGDGANAINVADLSYLVDYLFFDGPAPAPCP